MTRPALGTLLVIISLGMLWLHMTAMEYEWYFFHPLIDVPIHFLGGVIASLLILFLILLGRREFDAVSERALIFLMVGGTIMIGFSWEVFEYITGIEDVFNGDLRDTVIDLLMDLGGALLITIIALISREEHT